MALLMTVNSRLSVESASASSPEGEERPHLVDVTMYWSATGGGVARYLRDKRRWAVSRANWRHTRVVPADCEAPDCRIGGVRIPFSGGYRFPMLRNRVARLLVRLEPDLIEVGDPFRVAWAGLDAARDRGVPAVTFCHSNLADLAGRWFGSVARKAMRRYLHHVYIGFDAVFAASRWMVDEARDLGLDNVVHQPLGVDLATFNPSRRDPRWRSELGIDPKTVVLIYAGRFAKEKNPRVLSELPARLGPDHVLVALGAGPMAPQGERIRLLPYAADPRTVARALASADVFVHAGESETFGLAPLEALACGTPVVMPARAGLLDLVDGKAAFGVPHATADALAEAVRAVCTSSMESTRRAAIEAAKAFDQQATFAQLFARYAALRSVSASTDRGIGGLRLA